MTRKGRCKWCGERIAWQADRNNPPKWWPVDLDQKGDPMGGVLHRCRREAAR